MTDDILFYSRDEKYGWLSNFHRAHQRVNNIGYPTNEHYYQSMKAADSKIAEWIAVAPNPFLAMKAGRSLRTKKELRHDWETIQESGNPLKVDIMLIGLRAKYAQNDDLRKLLLDTYPAALHEKSPTDDFWGYLDGDGKDMLGKLQVQVRDEFKTGVTQPFNRMTWDGGL